MGMEAPPSSELPEPFTAKMIPISAITATTAPPAMSGTGDFLGVALVGGGAG